MKRGFSRYRLALFAISLASCTVFADQIWRGTSTCDVVDENLVIKDDVLLPLGGIRIEAIHKDVTVTLTRDVVLSGHWAGESDLYLVAAEGRTIRFELDHNLTLVGSSQITGDDLLVVQSGPGTVEVAVQDGNVFELTSQNCSGGALYYVLMYGGVNAPRDEYCDEYQAPCCPQSCGDEYACGGLFSCGEYGDEYCSPGSGCNENSASRPTLSFVSLIDESLRGACNKNRRVVIGPKSLMGFISSRKTGVGQDSGIIQFDPAFEGLSRMILEVQDTGAFIASGRYTCQRDGGCITLCNIQSNVSAGDQAIWRIINGSDSEFISSGLLVLDKNETMSALLVDPFLNNGAREDFNNFRGGFCGKQYGVILGANGVLSIESDSYLDFVGLALNQLPCPPFRNMLPASKLLKMRNPSALVIDGNLNPEATDAQIVFGDRAALFLRSGIGEDGTIRDEFDMDPFTVDAANRTHGVGNIVFDVEGRLNAVGVTPAQDGVSSKIELLSLEVFPTGGPLFVNSQESNFPLRTFNTEDNELLMYNCGAFLINNQMTLYNTALSHTDECHEVCPNNDLRSEPAYIGGDTWKLLGSDMRPSIRFINAELDVHTDVALTGLDLVVPNFVDDLGVLRPNLSNFTFFSNGPCVDNGTGRQMILGTRIGSTAADGCTRIDADAHLDIMQQEDAVISIIDPSNPDGDQTLELLSAMNDDTINNNIVDTEGTSIHTIFLGDSSNISIGVNADSTGFNIDTHPWLRIAGNVFAFAGRNSVATRSMITGKNAIFVDLNGKFSIEPGFIASICVMVIKSHNGIVDLPADQVFFCDGAGIATWNVNLANPDDQIIVGPDQALSTYVFNWLLAKKDCPNFIPFNCCTTSCTCPVVTEANVTGLPTIEGEIDDLQIQGTRIGDPAQFLIDGGFVRRLTFIPTSCTAEAPVAVIALRNNGRIGLDSTTTLGLNGVTIIADGSGQIVVNDDLIINNVCAIVKGPNFASCDVIELYSAVERQILVKSSGTLNLASFTDANEIVSIAGQLKLVLEPGATIITGAGTLRFSGNSQLLFEPAVNAESFFAGIPHGAHDDALTIDTVDAADIHNILSSLTNFGEGLHNTDAFRVKLVGEGTIELVDNATAELPFNAFVGIETLSTPTCEIATTHITLNIADNGVFAIGHFNYNEGGVLQIGNVEDLGENHNVNFTLTLDGENANFLIGSRGFLGIGVGIERFDGQPELLTVRGRTCPNNFVPNENIVSTLNDVGEITFNFFNGQFQHDRIFSGDDVNASLVAIGNTEDMRLNLNFEFPDENDNPITERSSDFNVAGGGNIVLVEEGNGGIHPVVLGQDGFITDRLSVGIMASTLLQPINDDQSGLTGAEFFEYIKTHDAALDQDRINTLGRANVASQGDSFRPEFDGARIDAVIEGVIVRGVLYDLFGPGTEESKRRNAIDVGAVFVDIDPTLGEILTASNIES
jgi:hypothetical protein